MILRIKHHCVDLLKKEAQKSHPVEACAVLFGNSNDENVIVRKVVVAPNRLQSTVRFEVDPEFVVKAFMNAEREGLDLVGLFHSHPAPATPSSVDVEFMRLWGSTIWLILSSTNGEMAAYQMKEGRLNEVTVEVE